MAKYSKPIKMDEIEYLQRRMFLGDSWKDDAKFYAANTKEMRAEFKKVITKMVKNSALYEKTTGIKQTADPIHELRLVYEFNETEKKKQKKGIFVGSHTYTPTGYDIEHSFRNNVINFSPKKKSDLTLEGQARQSFGSYMIEQRFAGLIKKVPAAAIMVARYKGQQRTAYFDRTTGNRVTTSTNAVTVVNKRDAAGVLRKTPMVRGLFKDNKPNKMGDLKDLIEQLEWLCEQIKKSAGSGIMYSDGTDYGTISAAGWFSIGSVMT